MWNYDALSRYTILLAAECVSPQAQSYMMTKSIVRYYYDLHICPLESIFWKLNPQSHVLMAFEGGAFGDD